MSSIDRYLIQAFDAVEDEIGRSVTEGRVPGTERILLPMLLRVVDAPWPVTDVPDLQITSRMGNIVACIGSLRTVEALRDDASVLAIEASRRGAGFDCSRSIPFIKANTVQQSPLSEKGDKALVAIIDGDIDVRHDAFRDSSGKQTRILAIWDQTDPTPPAGTSPKIGGYGREYTQTDINNIITGSAPFPASLVTPSADGHGTHVASIAAGRPGSQFAGGVAPETSIIVVIPRLQVGPTDPYSLGYSNSHVDALAYIKDFAQQRALPVVVNLSQGMNAGAHDGTSLLEAAFDNFSGGGREPGYVIVKSAGNERGYDGHAMVSVPNGGGVSLRWDSKQTHRGPDVIELWFKPCDKMNFMLHNPSRPTRESSPLVTLSNSTHSGQFLSGNKYEIFYERYYTDNGDSRLLVNIWKGSGVGIQAGTWELEIQGLSVQSPGEVHAWIERNDNRDVGFISHLNDDVTLSIPGTARTVISVGSVDASTFVPGGPPIPIQLATYSSYGPTRDGREKPELAAPGESINAADASSINGVKAKSGTSMAAPHVTGAIALLFSYWEKKSSKIPNWKQLNAAQIRAAISHLTQHYNSHHNKGTGFGVVDVEKLLQEF